MFLTCQYKIFSLSSRWFVHAYTHNTTKPLNEMWNMINCRVTQLPVLLNKHYYVLMNNFILSQNIAQWSEVSNKEKLLKWVHPISSIRSATMSSGCLEVEVIFPSTSFGFDALEVSLATIAGLVLGIIIALICSKCFFRELAKERVSSSKQARDATCYVESCFSKRLKTVSMILYGWIDRL